MFLMVVRDKADADYVRRLNVLRAAGGSLPLTNGTTALFAEREDRTFGVAATGDAAPRIPREKRRPPAPRNQSGE